MKSSCKIKDVAKNMFEWWNLFCCLKQSKCSSKNVSGPALSLLPVAIGTFLQESTKFQKVSYVQFFHQCRPGGLAPWKGRHLFRFPFMWTSPLVHQFCYNAFLTWGFTMLINHNHFGPFAWPSGLCLRKGLRENREETHVSPQLLPRHIKAPVFGNSHNEGKGLWWDVDVTRTPTSMSDPCRKLTSHTQEDRYFGGDWNGRAAK